MISTERVIELSKQHGKYKNNIELLALINRTLVDITNWATEKSVIKLIKRRKKNENRQEVSR